MPALGGRRREQQRAGGLGGAEEAPRPQRRVLVHRPRRRGVLGRRAEAHHRPAVGRGSASTSQPPLTGVDGDGGGPLGGGRLRPGPAASTKATSGAAPRTAAGQRERVGQVPSRVDAPVRSRPDGRSRHVPVARASRAARWAPDEAAGAGDQALSHAVRAANWRGATAATQLGPVGGDLLGVRARAARATVGEDAGHLDVHGSRPAVSAWNERRRKVNDAPSRASSPASSRRRHRVAAARQREAGDAEGDAGRAPPRHGGRRCRRPGARTARVLAAVDAQVVEADVDPGQRPRSSSSAPAYGVRRLDQDAEAAPAGDRARARGRPPRPCAPSAAAPRRRRARRPGRPRPAVHGAGSR